MGTLGSAAPAPPVPHGVAVLAVPLGPQGREVADLVAPLADVPGFGDELDARRAPAVPHARARHGQQGSRTRQFGNGVTARVLAPFRVGRRLGSWWAPRSSKPMSVTQSRWRVRFPSASANQLSVLVRRLLRASGGLTDRRRRATVTVPRMAPIEFRVELVRVAANDLEFGRGPVRWTSADGGAGQKFWRRVVGPGGRRSVLLACGFRAGKRGCRRAAWQAAGMGSPHSRYRRRNRPAEAPAPTPYPHRRSVLRARAQHAFRLSCGTGLDAAV